MMKIGVSNKIEYSELRTAGGDIIYSSAGFPIIIGSLAYYPTKISVKRICKGYYLRWWFNGWHYWAFLPGQMNMITEGEKYRTIGTRSVAISTGQINYDQCQAIKTLLNTREIYLLTSDGWRNIRIDPGSVITYKNQITGYEVELIMTIGSREVSPTSYSPVVDVPTIAPHPTSVDTIIITTVIDGVFTIVVTGEAGSEIYIDWGDGSPVETVVLTGGEDTITHDYTGSGGAETTIEITGDLDTITDLDLSGNDITEIVLADELTGLITLDLSDNELTEVWIPDTLVNLVELDLSNNNLTDNPIIPDTVPLEILDMDGNPLTTCEVQIGTQVWMCKNYDSNYPGSKVYNNNEANRDIYGGLYTFLQINSPGFLPAGWHVPTLVEWEALLNYLGGFAIAGGHLKEAGVTHWNAPNLGADDSSGLSFKGSGFYLSSLGFAGLKTVANVWTVSSVSDTHAYAIQMTKDAESAVAPSLNNLTYCAVRLLKNWAAPPPKIQDIDGNEYTYVTIGTQQWLVENFRCTKYADGTPIPNLTLAADWIAEDGSAGHDGAYCAYNNDPANIPDYGLLYNWHAVNNAHGLAMTGWKIPSKTDWETLTTFIGGFATGGAKLKEVGLTHWNAPNQGATDEYGFKALPTGRRLGLNGNYVDIQAYNALWSETSYNALNSWYVDMGANVATIDLDYYVKKDGYAIRLMRDL